MSGVKWVLSLEEEAAARAAVDTILALEGSGVSVTVELLRSGGPAPPTQTEARVRHLIDRPIDSDKTVLQLVPTAWPELSARHAGSYVIGTASWETNSLPAEWVAGCKTVDEVWVPSAWDEDVFARSGFEPPLRRMPVCLPDPDASVSIPAPIAGLGDESWVFYSILDWSERSNPRDLVMAYLAAFSGVRDVVLALVLTDLEKPSEEVLRRRIRKLKDSILLAHYPKIVALENTADRAQIDALHSRGDCFVQLSRGGGWDSHRFEAAARGTPVLASRFGGSEEYLSEATAYPVPVTLRPVENIPSPPLYLGKHLWAQPDVGRTVQLMRQAYDDRREARRKGALAAARLAEHNAPGLVASRLTARFEEIDRSSRRS